MTLFLHWCVNSLVKNRFNITPVNHWTFTVNQLYVLYVDCNSKSTLLYLNLHSAVLFSESNALCDMHNGTMNVLMQYLLQKWLHNKRKTFLHKCQDITVPNRRIIKKIIHNLWGTWLLLYKEENQMKTLNECYLFMKVPEIYAQK
jgi:hypothetical protein